MYITLTVMASPKEYWGLKSDEADRKLSCPGYELLLPRALLEQGVIINSFKSEPQLSSQRFQWDEDQSITK